MQITSFAIKQIEFFLADIELLAIGERIKLGLHHAYGVVIAIVLGSDLVDAHERAGDSGIGLEYLAIDLVKLVGEALTVLIYAAGHVGFGVVAKRGN